MAKRYKVEFTRHIIQYFSVEVEADSMGAVEQMYIDGGIPDDAQEEDRIISEDGPVILELN
jgi:hypothetical protein